MHEIIHANLISYAGKEYINSCGDQEYSNPGMSDDEMMEEEDYLKPQAGNECMMSVEDEMLNVLVSNSHPTTSGAGASAATATASSLDMHLSSAYSMGGDGGNTANYILNADIDRTLMENVRKELKVELKQVYIFIYLYAYRFQAMSSIFITMLYIGAGIFICI